MALRRIAIASAMLALLSFMPAQAQQPDMQAMMKWSQTKIVTWHIVGVYEGDPSISTASIGLAHVQDRIEIDVAQDWLGSGAFTSTPKIKNVPAAVTNPHDREPKCVAPILKGAFDYATLTSAKMVATDVEMVMRRTFPVVEVMSVCSSRKTSAASTRDETVHLFLPQPTFLAMGVSTGNMKTSADKKSIIMTEAPGLTGWTWTLTPTPG